MHFCLKIERKIDKTWIGLMILQSTRKDRLINNYLYRCMANGRDLVTKCYCNQEDSEMGTQNRLHWSCAWHGCFWIDKWKGHLFYTVEVLQHQPMVIWEKVLWEGIVIEASFQREEWNMVNGKMQKRFQIKLVERFEKYLQIEAQA